MDFTFTNLSSTEQHIGDFYGLTLAPAGEPGATKTITGRFASVVPTLTRTQALVEAGTITFSTTPSSAETSSGMLTPDLAVEASDMASVAAGSVESMSQTFYHSFAAPGGGGSPADVIIIAVDALPYKFRVIDAVMMVTTAVGASSSVLRDEAAGAGTAIATFDSGSTGRVVDATRDATDVITPGATKGLILRLSDDAVAGEIAVTIRRED